MRKYENSTLVSLYTVSILVAELDGKGGSSVARGFSPFCKGEDHLTLKGAAVYTVNSPCFFRNQ